MGIFYILFHKCDRVRWVGQIIHFVVARIMLNQWCRGVFSSNDSEDVCRDNLSGRS